MTTKKYTHYTVSFPHKSDLNKQQNSPVSGVIVWDNGSTFNGTIQDNMPVDGEFINSAGVKGIVTKWNLYLYSSSIFMLFLNIKPKTGNLIYNYSIVVKSARSFQYNTQFNGNINWPVGLKYHGQIIKHYEFYKIIVGRVTTMNGKQFPIYSKNFVMPSCGHLGCIEQITGAIIVRYCNFIQFQCRSNYFTQLNSSQNGIIKWQNGCKFDGAIQCNMPASNETFISQTGENGIIVKDNVYFPQSGNHGHISSDGSIEFSSNMLFFQNRQHYIDQYSNYSGCDGRIKWPNGNTFKGKIYQDEPLENFIDFYDFTDSDGLTGIFFSNWIYYPSTGQFGKIDMKFGTVALEKYELHFSQKCQFAKQIDGQHAYEGQIKGVVRWPSGNEYHGIVYKNKPHQKGELVMTDGRKIKVKVSCYSTNVWNYYTDKKIKFNIVSGVEL